MKFRFGRKIFSMIGFVLGFFVGFALGGEFSTEPNAPAGVAFFAALFTGLVFLVPAFLLGWLKDYMDAKAWRANT